MQNKKYLELSVTGYSKKAKNAEHLGLRSSISFFQLKDEPDVKIQTLFQ